MTRAQIEAIGHLMEKIKFKELIDSVPSYHWYVIKMDQFGVRMYYGGLN